MSKAQAITTNIATNHYTQVTIFKILIGSLAMLSLVYIYLIGSITFNILARKTLEASIRTQGTEISTLELTYLAEANKIDKGYALSLGFVDVHDNIFAIRDTTRVAIR